MTALVVSSGGGSRTRPKVDVGQLWAGRAQRRSWPALSRWSACWYAAGCSTSRSWRPRGRVFYGDADTTDFGLAAAGAAFLATALAHLLLVSTPGPLLFFWWIVGLASVAVVLYPFSTAAPLAVKAATAADGLVIGIAIGSPLSGVAERSTRVRQASEDAVSYSRGSSSHGQ